MKNCSICIQSGLKIKHPDNEKGFVLKNGKWVCDDCRDVMRDEFIFKS